VSYHEICQTHNIPGACQASSNYYHSISIQEVNNLIANKNCLQTTNTSNQKPTANANPCTGNVNIPKQTPFELTGSGSDSDGNNTLIFNWEQMDKAPARVVPWETAGLTTGPLFRSFLPSSTGNKRSFPGIANIWSPSRTTVPARAISPKARTLLPAPSSAATTPPRR